jgi:hypothetical protein
MKIGAIIRSYHMTDFLKQVIEQFDWIDRCLVVNAKYKGYSEAPDDTEAIVKSIKQDNLEILKLEELLEHEVLNKAIEHLSDCHLIYICDSDEFFDTIELRKLLYLGDFDFGMCGIEDYLDGKRLEKRTHTPVVIVRPYVRFSDKRCADGEGKVFSINMKHLWIKNDWKTENYKKFLPTERYLEL